MKPLANVNGQIMPLDEVRITPLDRGFLFGDAVYEVLRVYGGRPFLLDEHLERLAHSLEAIRIGGIDLGRLRRRILDTIAAGPFGEAVVYIQITRGAAPRTHAFPAGAVPLEFLYVEAFEDRHPELRERGAAVITYPDIRWDRCDIKSTNLLGNVLAAQAAKEAGAYEAILYLPDGTITEGSRTSFFGVLGGRLLTAPATSAILPGITRRLILDLARAQAIPIEEHVLTLADLPRVTELFLTGTTSEVLPVVRVDGQPVADGRPGPVTRRLQEAYRRAASARAPAGHGS
jgi:D-alanine transaminase